MRMVALVLLALLPSPLHPASDESSSWQVDLRPGSTGPASHTVWVGLRHDEAQPRAFCVRSTAFNFAESLHADFLIQTRSCTKDVDAHLLLPGQTHYLLMGVPKLRSGTAVDLMLEVVSWDEKAPIESKGRILKLRKTWLVP